MVNSMEGLYNIKTFNETIEYVKVYSNSNCNIKVSLDIIIKNKNVTENQVTLSEVYYINDLSWNIISYSRHKMVVFHINDQDITVKFINNKMTLYEHLMIDCGDGYLMWFEVSIRGNIKEFISINKLDKLLGHPGWKSTLKTAKKHNITLSDNKMNICERCELSKSRRFNLNKIKKPFKVHWR